MFDKAMRAKARSKILEAGYQYACKIFYSGQDSIAFRNMLEEFECNITKETLSEIFEESACHEGIETEVWHAFKAIGIEYIAFLESLDWDEILEIFCEGGSRRIDEILRDA